LNAPGFVIADAAPARAIELGPANDATMPKANHVHARPAACEFAPARVARVTMEWSIVADLDPTRQKTPCCDPVRLRYTARMPFGMGIGELVLILVIVTLVFGATKLPQLGDGLGRAIKNFKRSIASINEIDVTPRAEVPGETAPSAKPAPGGETPTK
jgi:sec-independent protein translocase protein TatA